MQKPQILRFSLLCVVMGLGACSTLPKQVPAGSVAAADSLELTKAAVGSRISLPLGNALGVSSVRIVDEYLAASGRLCRLVEVTPSGDETRVMCQRAKGEWSFTRPLISSSLKQDFQSVLLPIVPVEAQLEIPGSVIVDTASQEMVASSSNRQSELLLGAAMAMSNNTLSSAIRLKMEQGENLWRFAARTTGNAINWQYIAEANGISDAGKVLGGSMLNVPANLFESNR